MANGADKLCILIHETRGASKDLIPRLDVEHHEVRVDSARKLVEAHIALRAYALPDKNVRVGMIPETRPVYRRCQYRCPRRNLVTDLVDERKVVTVLEVHLGLLNVLQVVVE